MNEYILIFRQEEGKKFASPEQLQTWMEQTMKWIKGIADQGKFSGGNGFSSDESQVVRHQVVTDGPFGRIRERVSGYIIVRAESLAEAVGFAKGCPALKDEGTTVEVRSIPGGDGFY